MYNDEHTRVILMNRKLVFTIKLPPFWYHGHWETNLVIGELLARHRMRMKKRMF